MARGVFVRHQGGIYRAFGATFCFFYAGILQGRSLVRTLKSQFSRHDLILFSTFCVCALSLTIITTYVIISHNLGVLWFVKVKGTMSPQVHAQVDEKYFEIVGPTFSHTVREFRRLLYHTGCKCKRLLTDFEFIYIYIYPTESDSGCRKQASLRRNTPLRKRPTGLYCACAPADIVALNC